MVIAMCKAEPKNAQFAMQSLAQRIRSGLRGEALAFVRFALGVLFRIYTAVAYAEGRCGEGDLPAELELPVRWNPEIIECAEEVGALFSDNDQD